MDVTKVLRVYRLCVLRVAAASDACILNTTENVLVVVRIRALIMI